MASSDWRLLGCAAMWLARKCSFFWGHLFQGLRKSEVGRFLDCQLILGPAGGSRTTVLITALAACLAGLRLLELGFWAFSSVVIFHMTARPWLTMSLLLCCKDASPS